MDDLEQDDLLHRDHPANVTIASQPSDPSASKPKLCFQIKMANNSKPSGAAGPNLHGTCYRVCEYCGKEFSSGKAWGGHKRHHLKNDKDLKKARKLELTKFHREKMKKQELKSAKSNSSRCNTIKAGDVNLSNEGKTTCCLCGKIFPSMKSLFGHMRFHPDRGWKGTQPPSYSDKHSRSPGLSEAAAFLAMKKSSDDGVNLLTSLSSWSKRDKRGRTLYPVEAACNFSPVEAAGNLIELSRDSGRIEKQKIDDARQRKKQSATKSSEPKNSGNTTDIEEEVELRMGTDDQKVVSLDREWGDSYWSNEEKGKRKRESNEIDDETHSMITKNKKRKLMMNWMGKLNDSETLEGTRSYESLPAFLAPSCLANVDRAEVVKHNSNVDVKGHVLPASEVKQAEEIEEDGSIGMGISCDIFRKKFPTGQAPGGHKRCQGKGPVVKAPPHEAALLGEACQNTSNTESSGEPNQAGEAIRASACRLSFDLNLPCIMEDGEQMFFPSTRSDH